MGEANKAKIGELAVIERTPATWFNYMPVGADRGLRGQSMLLHPSRVAEVPGAVVVGVVTCEELQSVTDHVPCVTSYGSVESRSATRHVIVRVSYALVVVPEDSRIATMEKAHGQALDGAMKIAAELRGKLDAAEEATKKLPRVERDYNEARTLNDQNFRRAGLAEAQVRKLEDDLAKVRRAIGDREYDRITKGEKTS